jgi:hypothetical protein
VVSPDLEARFPAEALCEVEIVTTDGTVFRSGICGARGDPGTPLSDDELMAKFRTLAAPVIGPDGAREIERAVEGLDVAPDLDALLAPLRLHRVAPHLAAGR